MDFLDFSGFRAWIWGVRGPDYGFLFISPTQLLKLPPPGLPGPQKSHQNHIFHVFSTRNHQISLESDPKTWKFKVFLDFWGFPGPGTSKITPKSYFSRFFDPESLNFVGIRPQNLSFLVFSWKNKVFSWKFKVFPWKFCFFLIFQVSGPGFGGSGAQIIDFYSQFQRNFPREIPLELV